MIVLIPAYESDEKLIKLVDDINKETDFKIIIVDDGSGENYKNIFKELQKRKCIVLSYEKNKGKGQALKTGFKYIKENNIKDNVVTADCDGQHLVKDIINIAQKVKEKPKSIVLGERKFVGKVPLRSKIGNTLTRYIFYILSKNKVYDTQTGLRGFSYLMIDWLCNINGNRYEYEMNELLQCREAGYNFCSVNINTIYLNDNKSSHFNAIKDSLLIYIPIIKFSMSSLFCGIIDYLLLFLFNFISENLLLSVVASRVISSILNYGLNKVYVFKKDISMIESSIKYFLLVIVILFLNYNLIKIYLGLGFKIFFAKILTEVTLFVFSYISQKKIVFKKVFK